jgi:hypothetical protein
MTLETRLWPMALLLTGQASGGSSSRTSWRKRYRGSQTMGRCSTRT